MLAHVLAVLLGFSSFVFYMAAFFYPEVHRRLDIIWSGLGLFYAVVLWFCAGQMTATVMLSQVMAVVLLLGLGWQTLSVRREKTPVYQQTPIVLTPEVVGSWAKNQLNQLRIAPDDTVRPLPPQNRSLSATAADRFRQNLDPRRRPVYDYEFVEDGEPVSDGEPVTDGEAVESVDNQSFDKQLSVDFQKLATLEDAFEDALEEDARAKRLEDADVIPPSAEAKVLSATLPDAADVSSSEPESSGFDKADQTVEKSSDSDSTDSELTEPEPIESQPTEPELTEPGLTESELTGPQSEEPGPTEPQSEEIADSSVDSDAVKVGQDENETSSERGYASSASAVAAEEENADSPPDDWGIDSDEDWLEDPLREEETKKESNRLPFKQKPSLIATPVIVLGWVKDVIGAMTKPKPSKPVINIPRRDASPSADTFAQADSSRSTPSTDVTANSFSKRDGKAPPRDDPTSPGIFTGSYPVNETSNEAPPSDEPPELDNSDNFDDDDNWEESNWDD